MLEDGVFSHGPMGGSYLCRAQDVRGCSWMGCSTMGPSAIPTCAAHKVLVDALGWGALPWGHERSMPVQCTRCSCIPWMGCSPMDP